MLGYRFLSDCFGPLFKVTPQKPYGLEPTKVSEIILDYLLHHLSLALGPPVTAGKYFRRGDRETFQPLT